MVSIKAEIPNRIEFEIFDKVWGVLNGNPTAEETPTIAVVAEAYKRTPEQVDEILTKVTAYKIEVNEVMFRNAKFKTIGKITHYAYEPTNDTVVVKLKYDRGAYRLAVSQVDERMVRDHVFGNLLMVRKLSVGFYDSRDSRINERTHEKPKA